MSNKIIAVIELETTDLDGAEELMYDLLWAGEQAGVLVGEGRYYLMEGTESTGEALH